MNALQVGSVYAIQAGESGPIKIGFTTSVYKRVTVLQSSHYEVLRVRAAIDGTPAIEQEIRAELKSAHIRGEWYTPTPEVIALVERMAKRPSERFDRFANASTPEQRSMLMRDRAAMLAEPE